MVFLTALISAPAKAGIIVSISASGSSDAWSGSGPVGQHFAGYESVACSATGGASASTACSNTGLFTATDGSGAAIQLTVSANTDASFGHILFHEALATDYIHSYSSATGSNFLEPITGSAAGAFIVQPSGLSGPGFVQLTFLGAPGSAYDFGPPRQNYSIVVGNNAPWTFTVTGGLSTNEFSMNFPLASLADPFFFSMTGTISGSLYFQDCGCIISTESLDLTGLQFLDAAGNALNAGFSEVPTPEPASLTVIGLLALLGGTKGWSLLHRSRRP